MQTPVTLSSIAAAVRQVVENSAKNFASSVYLMNDGTLKVTLCEHHFSHEFAELSFRKFTGRHKKNGIDFVDIATVPESAHRLANQSYFGGENSGLSSEKFISGMTKYLVDSIEIRNEQLRFARIDEQFIIVEEKIMEKTDFFATNDADVIDTKYYEDANHGFAHLGFEVSFETSDIMPDFDGGYIAMMGQNSSDRWSFVDTPPGMHNSRKNIDAAIELTGSYRESERPHLQICEDLTAMGYWVQLIHNRQPIDWKIAKYYTNYKK